MKKSMIGVAVLALCATFAQALPQESGEAASAAAPVYKMPPNPMGRLVDRLALTDEQKQEIAEIRKNTIADNAKFLEALEAKMVELQTAREANDVQKIEALKATIEVKREELARIHETELERIMNALTREQHIQFEELKAKREARKSARKNGQ